MIAADDVVITKYYIHKVICEDQENGTLKYKNDKTIENKKYFKPNQFVNGCVKWNRTDNFVIDNQLKIINHFNLINHFVNVSVDGKIEAIFDLNDKLYAISEDKKNVYQLDCDLECLKCYIIDEVIKTMFKRN